MLILLLTVLGTSLIYVQNYTKCESGKDRQRVSENFKRDFKRCSLKSGLVDVNGKCDKNGESGKNGIFAMRLANIPIILESGDFDANGENLLARVNLAKKLLKV